jgi:spore coat polysaccharide biosynthesis predicted glycosyltransferase SpsG
MNRDPILFRVDAAASVGYERLTRCLTYASALQRRRRPTFFLSQLEPRSLGLAIKRTGSEWLEADALAGLPEDLAETVQEIRRLRPAAVIVDAASATEDYLTELQATGPCVVSIDHLANIRLPSDLVINPLLGPGKEAYEHGPRTQLLLGTRYALVRSEIRRVRPARAQEPPAPFGALIAVPDADPELKTAELVKLLLSVPKLDRVDLVLRAEHPALGPLQALAAAYPERIKIATETAEIASRIARCHFAITSGNGFSLELACVGVPQLILVQSEAHWPTAQRLEEEGAATCLGAQDNVSPTIIRQAVQTLLTDPLERQAMARCGRQLIDARGPDRLVTALEVVLHRSEMVREFAAAA